MKSIWRFSLSKVLLLAIAAVGTAAMPAQAQSAAGTFSLAHKVLWAGAVLPAGDYAFSVNTEALPPRVTVRQVGGPVVAMLLSQSTSEDDYVGASSLVLHYTGGESVVSTLRLKNIGMALEFATPKLATPVMETAGLEPIADSQPAK